MFFIFSLLTIYAFSVNSKNYLEDSDGIEYIPIDDEPAPYALTIKRRSDCVNCGTCVALAPDALEIRADNKVGRKPGGSAISAKLAEELKASCPSNVFVIDTE